MRTAIEVRPDGEIVWLSPGQIAELVRGLFPDLKMMERYGEGGILPQTGGVA